MRRGKCTPPRLRIANYTIANNRALKADEEGGYTTLFYYFWTNMNASNGSINTALVDSFRSFYFPFALIVAIWPKILRNSIKTHVLDAFLREMTKKI